jgi:hypothetical protein
MTTYSGSLALRLAGIEELLARSATFQKRMGAGSVSQAKDKIFAGEMTLLDALDAVETGSTLSDVRPCAIVGPEMHSFMQLSQGSQLGLGADGAVWVLLTDNPKNPENHKLSLLDFTDWTSAVMDEVAALVGKDYGATGPGATTLWPFNAIRMLLPPLRPDLADRQGEDYWLCGYVLFDSIGGSH